MSARLDLEAFQANASDFDASVEAEPEIDHFCSGSAWILPFHSAFLPDRELHFYRADRAFVALAARSDPNVGVFLEALETMWQFACPLVGPGCAELLAGAQHDIARRLGVNNVPIVLPGVPLSGGLARALVSALRGRHQIHAVDTTVRYVASLEGGVDGWLSRRSPSLRRNLRAATRRGNTAGLAFEHACAYDADAARDLYTRILAIERESWKSGAGVGADLGPMEAFYREMLPQLATERRLRVIFAKLDGRDVGYLHGGTVGRHFRGLQMSFDERHAELSIGNLLQQEMIATLCEQGYATYDLGARPGYKERWAEPGLRTVTLVCRPER